jgi:hypothetical protein
MVGTSDARNVSITMRRCHALRVKQYADYTIRAAMASDQGSSIMYVFDEQEPDATRVYLRIKRKGRAVVWCEGVINDSNYRDRYSTSGQGRRLIPNDPLKTVTMGAWYRQLLGIERSGAKLPDTPLNVRVYRQTRGLPWYHLARWKPSRAWLGAVQVSLQHPVSTNRIAMWFALLGAALGIISLVIAFVLA